MQFKTIALAIAALGTAGSANAVNLVTNGGFELLSPRAATGKYHICDNTKPSCVSVLTGWTATAAKNGPLGTSSPGSVLLGGKGGAEWNSAMGMYGPIPNSPLGGNFIGIDGDPDYSQSISQTINGLHIGHIYVLTFYQSAGQQKGLSGATTERWQVDFGGFTRLSTNQFNASKSFLPWTFQTMTFKATAVSQVLRFLARGTPNGLPPVVLLDGVSLQAPAPAPEPGTWAMMVAGFGIVGASARRRRKAAA